MRFSRLLLAVALVSVVACAPEEGAVIKKKGNGFELRIDGVPTFIKGVGGRYHHLVEFLSIYKHIRITFLFLRRREQVCRGLNEHR